MLRNTLQARLQNEGAELFARYPKMSIWFLTQGMDWIRLYEQHNLTPRSYEVIWLRSQGLGNYQVSETMCVTRKTVFCSQYNRLPKNLARSMLETVLVLMKDGVLPTDWWNYTDDRVVQARSIPYYQPRGGDSVA